MWSRMEIDGVFSMTPDNLPVLGPHPDHAGIWVAQAIWVTHVGGAASVLSRALLNDGPLMPELAIDRFNGQSPGTLRESARRLYRDIYANWAEQFSTPTVLLPWQRASCPSRRGGTVTNARFQPTCRRL
jgi:hypothetical protein